MAQLRHRAAEFIQNDKARLATFNRRSHCLLKKASELSILCDVDVAVFIYADHLADRPLTFPPEASESFRIINQLKANPRYVAAAKSNPDKYMNAENHSKPPNDSFGDDISSLNAYELESLVRILDAKEEQVVKKINAIRQRNNESVVDEETPENNSGFQNQVSGYLDNNYSEELMSLNVFEAAIDEISDPSNSEQLAEKKLGFLHQFSAHLNSNYDKDITNLKAIESASLAWIRDAMEEDDIGPIGVTSNRTTPCLNVSEFVSDEFADPNSFFFSRDGRPSTSVSEISKGLESELFDHLPHDFQTASSSSPGMIIPCPHHGLTESSSWLLDPIVPIMEVEPEEAEDQSNCESLAAMFYEEAPGLNCLFSTSEIPMYHQYESLDYQPFGCQRPIPCSSDN